LLAISIASRDPRETEFKTWMSAFSKKYSGLNEYNQRFQIYLDNSEIVKQLNMNLDNVTYALGPYGDWTNDEFRRLLGAKPSGRTSLPLVNAPLDTAPAAFDWCGAGYCTPIKDQGQCGSCWAFATTENIESVHRIAGGNLPVLSPQQIVDCDTGEAGCGGGDPAQAYEYVVQQGGLDTAASYPYVGVQGGCRFNPATVGARIVGERNGFGGSEQQMAANLASTAPFSILVDASSWQFYSGGVLPSSQCGQQLDHAVVAVGYNMNQGFWRVRNSWGAGWGQSGFIYLQFGANTCGMDYEVLTSVA
jgi:C1A family cysteine protease